MKTISFKILTCLVIFIISFGQVNADIGNTIVAKWKDNKKGAFSLRFDDSMMSHRDHTVPNLVKRGLTGSFFINPATNRYGYGIDTWESIVSRTGMEICPHTMNHFGAADLAEADYEIGEAFRKVWELNPSDKSKLYPFQRGGGTTWPSGYVETVQRKYPVADYSADAVSYEGADNRNELIAFAKKAMNDNAWHMILTHGTGPNLEWLGFEVSNFEALLDYLVSVKDRMWIGNLGDINKYITERKSVTVNVISTDNRIIRLNLNSGTDPEFYDFPLTLITDVPTDWNYCQVLQGTIRGIYPVKAGQVMYDAVPGRGEIVLKNSAVDNTPPSKVVVRDGTGEDVNAWSSVTILSANWNTAEDVESGISRYWYKVGTTPGGAEVLDWIDNGFERNFITSRSHFSLTRGEKYYITVKAVNGVGMSSESTSDGFVVNVTSGHISFSEDFDNGYLSGWNEKRTKTGSQKNILYLSDKAASDGNYGMQCHIVEKDNSYLFLVKNEITEEEDVFTRFYFKIGSGFSLPGDGHVQLVELRDGSGGFVAGVYIGYQANIGIHVYALSLDNTGYRASLPGSRDDYPLSFVPVEPEKWHRVDIRTIAHEGNGGAEFWLNGTRKGSIHIRFTGGKSVRTLCIGTMNIVNENTAGEIFFDNIAVSDSRLK